MIFINEILPELEKDPIRNVNLINFMLQYRLYSVDRVGDSFLIKGRSDHSWIYISSNNISEFEEIVTMLNDDDEYFAIIEDWMMPHLIQDKKIVWKLSCMKLFFPDNKEIPEAKSRIEDINDEYAEYIFKHSKYSDFTSIDYIIERINKGVAFGICQDDQLVAWLMTQDDGAMGFLHVLDEYRGRGYAQDLTYKMIKYLRKQNQIPFVHIEENNISSMNLALKIGFQKDRRIHWLYRRNKLEAMLEERIKEKCKKNMENYIQMISEWFAHIIITETKGTIDHSWDPPWDHSGRLVSTDEKYNLDEYPTFFDFLDNDYSGNTKASYLSGCGLFHETYIEELDYKTMNWISDNVQLVVEELIKEDNEELEKWVNGLDEDISFSIENADDIVWEISNQDIIADFLVFCYPEEVKQKVLNTDSNLLYERGKSNPRK
ncbi:MAG: GNAT family N-acetyltransferase [Halanaerobiales bacterium]|nr:GNAT family N-acetyltransferase [Halanaerobiales bacterium]